MRLPTRAWPGKGLGRRIERVIDEIPCKTAFSIAVVYAFRNQPDKAFEWLDRAYAEHDPNLDLTKVHPQLKNLHNDPRYAAFLKKLNLPN